MKIIVFAFVFMALIASAALAAGLEITEIDAAVDYDEAYTYRIENRNRIDTNSVAVANGSKVGVDILPGSNITFTVRVENTFQSSGPDLRGVFATITIEEIDDGADLEEDSIDFDLEPGDDVRADIKFGIPLDVDASTYNAILRAEGDDRNGTAYETEVSLKLEVKKDSHDIRITDILLNPGTVDCDRKTRLTAEITNAGSNRETEVALEFRSGNLGINSFDKDLTLESSNEASEEEKMHAKTLNIEVPSFLREGTYPILVNLYWKNFVLFDQKTANLVVKDCASRPSSQPVQENGPTEPEGPTGPVEVIKPETQEGQAPEDGVITATEEAPFAGSLLLSIYLGGFMILVIFLAIAIIYFKRKKNVITDGKYY